MKPKDLPPKPELPTVEKIYILKIQGTTIQLTHQEAESLSDQLEDLIKPVAY